VLGKEVGASNKIAALNYLVSVPTGVEKRRVAPVSPAMPLF
jgi:hypothetical protein